PEGTALSGGDHVRLHHPRLSPHRRGAFRGRLRAAAPFGRGLRAGDPRHRRAHPQPHRRRDLDGQAADAAVRGHRAVRHAHTPGAVAAIGRAEARRNRWTAVALWMIAALLAWMIWLLI